jgi:hypothetical protein
MRSLEAAKEAAMSRWRALSLFVILVAALVLAAGPATVIAQQREDRDTSRRGDDEREAPAAERDEPAPVETRSPRRAGLSREAIEDALRHGQAERGKNQALVLRDTGRAISNVLSTLADEPTEGSGFWIEIYTPLSWIAQLASDAARDYRDLSPRDLDDDDLRPVLRVIVHPDMPDRVSHRGMRLSQSVEHVVIKPRKDKHAPPLQPLSRREFDETAVGRHGRRATFSGVEAAFDLQAVAGVIQDSRDGEFDVIVVGAGYRDKSFGVKRKHFDQLPGLGRF